MLLQNLIGLASGLATSSAFDWSTVISSDSFTPIVTGMTSVVGGLIAATISVVVVKKVFSFIVGRIRRV